MERVEFTNSRGLRLAGEWRPSDGACGLVLAHGFTSDKSSRGRFHRLAEALNAARYHTLAFDFAGCGESSDDLLTLPGQQDDLLCATRFLRSLGVQQVAWYGHSLGSLIALRAWTPEIPTMVLTGAATGPIRYDWPSYFSPAQLHEWRTTGRLTVNQPEGLRRRVVVDGALLDAFEHIDQPALLGNVHCPVLIVHGDTGDEERRLLANSRAALPLLPAGSRLEVIPGAAHGFDGCCQRVIDVTLAWLEERFPA